MSKRILPVIVALFGFVPLLEGANASCYSLTPDACQFGFYNTNSVIGYFAAQHGFTPENEWIEDGETPDFGYCVNSCAATYNSQYASCLNIPEDPNTGNQAKNSCIAAAETALSQCMSQCTN